MGMEQTDEQFLLRVHKRIDTQHETPFEAVINEAMPDMLRFAHSRTRSTQDAEDLVQLTSEAILKTLRRAHKQPDEILDVITNPRHYLIKVLNNKYKDALEASNRQKRGSGNTPLRLDDIIQNPKTHTLAGISPSAEALTNQRLLTQRLQRSIAKLTPRHQRLIRMRHIDQMSFPDIAEETGSNANTIKQAMLRAEEALKRVMNEEEG